MDGFPRNDHERLLGPNYGLTGLSFSLDQDLADGNIVTRWPDRLLHMVPDELLLDHGITSQWHTIGPPIVVILRLRAGLRSMRRNTNARMLLTREVQIDEAKCESLSADSQCLGHFVNPLVVLKINGLILEQLLEKPLWHQ